MGLGGPPPLPPPGTSWTAGSPIAVPTTSQLSYPSRSITPNGSYDPRQTVYSTSSDNSGYPGLTDSPSPQPQGYGSPPPLGPPPGPSSSHGSLWIPTPATPTYGIWRSADYVIPQHILPFCVIFAVFLCNLDIVTKRVTDVFTNVDASFDHLRKT